MRGAAGQRPAAAAPPQPRPSPRRSPAAVPAAAPGRREQETPVWKEVDDQVPLAGGRARLRIHAHWVPGPAPSVVLLHGLLSSGRQWRGTMTRLSGTSALWAPDLPGFGRSGLIRTPQRLTDYADALEAWAERRDVGRAVVVGHSFGGMVAIDWAVRYPSRVAALGLLAPLAAPHAFGVPRPFARRGLGRLLLLLVSLPLVRERFFSYVVDEIGAVPVADRLDYVWGMRRCRALLGLLDFYAFPDAPAVLGAVRCPVRLGWGLHDRILPVADADVLAAAIPGLPVVRWPCGHAVMAERPADGDRFVREVAALAAAP